MLHSYLAFLSFPQGQAPIHLDCDNPSQAQVDAMEKVVKEKTVVRAKVNLGKAYPLPGETRVSVPVKVTAARGTIRRT